MFHIARRSNGFLSHARARFFVFTVGLIALADLRAAQPRPVAPREPVPEGQFVPPATPLVACDPYFSIWSAADKLTDRGTTHWTGKTHPLSSLARIDGKAYRVMGA